MTLFEKLKDVVSLGWSINFSLFLNQIEISVKRENIKGYVFERKSVLPIFDHFYENKIIDCIDWCIKDIEEDNEE